MSFVDYDFNDCYFDVDGHRMHYIDEGNVEHQPMVMVHGNPTWSYYYRGLIKAFGKDYRCIALDHIGMGLSDRPSDKDYSYHFEQRVDDLESLLEHLGLGDNITLVVHDWGGMIGMAYATRHPEKIKRLIILNTGAFHLPDTKKMPWQLRVCRLPILGEFFVRGLNGFSGDAVKSCVTRFKMSDDVRRGYLEPYNSWKKRIAVARFVQDIPLKKSDPGYDMISQVERHLKQFDRIPVMICWGMKDFCFDHHFLRVWQEHLPSARVHRFEDCGHYILEDAGDQVIACMNDFFEAHPLV